MRKKRQITSGFTQAGVYARRQFCADLEVYRTQELLWNPRLREAATTLGASGRQRGGKWLRNQDVRGKQPDPNNRLINFITNQIFK